MHTKKRHCLFVCISAEGNKVLLSVERAVMKQGGKMHSYLKSIGFGKISKESEIDEILQDVYQNYEYRTAVKKEEGAFVEMYRKFAPDMGICLCGMIDETGFHRQYYFPYYESSGVTTVEEINLEQRSGGDSCAGICDDGRVGFSLIFYLQNPSIYHKTQGMTSFGRNRTETTFTGLASEGSILLPVRKNEKFEAKKHIEMMRRTSLVSAAKNGDQDAMESLTIEDMDLYSMVSRRIEKEDVFSIVNTYFMPGGMECDQYQILGNILYYTKVKNQYTGEQVYQMNIECNDMIFNVCINASDLLGDPDEGRRFKGTIWLQGKVNCAAVQNMRE